jgi:hypothetical protein
MKKLFALTLLVAALAVAGCAEKKPAAKPTTSAPPATTDKPAETTPAK